MEHITLKIGIVTATGSVQQDLTRDVEFVGEELARRKVYGYSDRTGEVTDTRGITETLYRVEDGRLVVYVEEWSHWQGEPNRYHLLEVTEDDLGVNGRFEALGREAGFGRSLTLDEALSPSPAELPGR